jgi:hypothetical protein
LSRDAAEPGAWSALRAVLVAVHVLVVVLSAVPSPEGGMDRRSWEEPTVRAEIGAWAERLGQPREAFTERLWSLAQGYSAGLDVVLAPVRRYERLTGTAQSWKMFVAPHRFPARLRIEARAGEDAPWESVYAARSDTADWMRDALDHERLRASVFRWSWPRYRTVYRHGCEALARRLFEERPELTTARCSLGRARSPSPEEVASGEVPEPRWGDLHVVKR